MNAVSHWKRWLGLVGFLVGTFLFGCNLSEDKSDGVISISLNVDATGTVSNYDSIRVDILNGDETPFKDRAVVVKAVKITNNTITFDLGKSPPDIFYVVITGYSKNAPTMKVKVKYPNSQGNSGWIVIINPKNQVSDTTVTLDPRSLTLIEGASAVQVHAAVLPVTAVKGVTWSSSAVGVASVDTNGWVLPLKEGEATISARSRDNIAKFDQIPVLVKKAGPKAKPNKVIIITTSPLTLAVNGTAQRIQAEVQPSDADPGLTWFSSATTVASVDADGMVTPGVQGTAKIIATSKTDLTLKDTLDINVVVPKTFTGITVTQKAATLYVGGAGLVLTANVQPPDPTAALSFTSSETGTVTVGADGRLAAVAAGDAYIFVQPLGNPGIVDTCRVKVIKDVPLIDAGPSRKVNIGDEVTYSIKVTQKYGDIAALKWDLDGNGIWDPDSSKDSTAAPKWKYMQANPDLTARFYVRDTEGNEGTASVKVSVGSKVPLVDITKPSKRDSLLNTAAFTVEYTADGVAKTRKLNLKEGLNPLEIADTNASGVGIDSIYITLDTKLPVIAFSAPLPGATTNNNTISVAWTSDAIPQTTKLSESLAGKQGRITITREAVDSAGNRGTGSVDIFRDTIGPAVPTFTSTTTASPTNNPKPSWAWAGGGGGNGTFRYIFNGQPEVETGLKAFSPATLADGSYTLTVRELDSVGNLSTTASRTIVVQTKGPGTPVVTGNAGPTKTPQWTWTRAVAGSTFIATLFKAGEAAAQDTYEGTTASYSPAGTLLTGSNGVLWTLKVKEKDALGNWSDEGSAQINVDVVAPNAPGPTVAQYSQGAPNFAWTATEAGAKYVYRLVRVDNGTAVSNGTISALLYNPGNVVADAVSYRLYLAAQDVAGNTGLEGNATTLVDLNAPAVAITGPTVAGSITTENPTISGTVSDANGIKSLTYAVENGESGPVSFSGSTWAKGGISFAPGNRKVTITATDNANRTSTAEITITKLSKVVFVRKDGSGLNGKSWQNAYKELSDALSGFNTFDDGTEIWVADGSYASTASNPFNGRSKLTILGGFSANGTARSNTERTAQLATTRNTILTSRIGAENLNTFVLDGFQIVSTSIYVYQSTGIEFRNCSIRDIGTTNTDDVFDVTESNLKFINSNLYNGIGSSHGVMYIWNSIVEFTDATVNNNHSIHHEGPVVLTGTEAKAILINSKFYGSTTYDNVKAQIGFNNFGSAGGTIAMDAFSRTNLEGGVCKIGRRANGTVTDLSGNLLTCP